jgi:hypothetical protein
MPTCHGSRTEEIAMGAEAGADQFKSVFHDTVDQYKVRFDMAVTVSDELTFKRMVMERWRKRLLGAKQIDHGCNLFQTFATPNRKFEVSRELLCKDAIEHGGQSSISNAALSISSVLLKGP